MAAFVVSHDLDGVLPPEPGGVFRPLTPMGFGSPVPLLRFVRLPVRGPFGERVPPFGVRPRRTVRLLARGVGCPSADSRSGRVRSPPRRRAPPVHRFDRRGDRCGSGSPIVRLPARSPPVRPGASSLPSVRAVARPRASTRSIRPGPPVARGSLPAAAVALPRRRSSGSVHDGPCRSTPLGVASASGPTIRRRVTAVAGRLHRARTLPGPLRSRPPRLSMGRPLASAGLACRHP